MVRQYRNKKWLKNKYQEENLSDRKIGKLCGVSHFAISYQRRKFDILPRTTSETSLGRIAWNKGLTKEIDSRIALSEETKLNIGKGSKGRKVWNKGIPCSEETKLKISKTNRGENCHNWKGGITPLTLLIRSNYKYRQWRSDVYTRDNFTCQMCGDNKGGNLNAHHIKPFSVIIQEYEITTLKEALECEELWNINNGITKCEVCHKNLNKKGDD